jgi:hypothetical protein
MVPQIKAQIIRDPDLQRCLFVDCFRDFEKVETVRQILGEKTESVLQNLKVEFTEETRYMKVSDVDGHLMVNPHYLNNAETVDLYLDIIHELVHVKQFSAGKQLFDKNYSYVERPTEIEAYRITVDEARALGLSDESISRYLRSELVDEEEFKRLAKKLNLEPHAHPS